MASLFLLYVLLELSEISTTSILKYMFLDHTNPLTVFYRLSGDLFYVISRSVFNFIMYVISMFQFLSTITYENIESNKSETISNNIEMVPFHFATKFTLSV